MNDTTKEKITKALKGWSDGPKVLVAHEDSVPEAKELARYVGSTEEIIQWTKENASNISTIYVVGPEKLVYGMKSIQPKADIQRIEI